MPWDRRLATGIPSVDAEHRILISILDQLNAAMSAGSGAREVRRTVVRLERYTQSHFDREVGLMRASRYPEAREHDAQHREYLEMVTDLRARADAGVLGVAVDANRLLKSWLSDHIRISDGAYGMWLVEEGKPIPA